MSANTFLKNNFRRARTAITFFWATFGATIISGILNVLLLIEVQKEGLRNIEGTFGVIAAIQTLYNFLYCLIIIASIVIFLNWFRRAYANLYRIGINYLVAKESWAIWGFIVPIILLYRPYQIIKEIWTETQDQIKKRDSTFSINKDTTFLGLWWFLFLSSRVINTIGWVILINASSRVDMLDQLIKAYQLFISSMLRAIEAFILILIIKNISKFEAKLFSRVYILDISNFGENDEPDQNFEANAQVSLSPQ